MEESILVNCPFCGESFYTFVDLSAGNQDYTEDCQVCCRPIVMHIQVKKGRVLRIDCNREY